MNDASSICDTGDKTVLSALTQSTQFVQTAYRAKMATGKLIAVEQKSS